MSHRHKSSTTRTTRGLRTPTNTDPELLELLRSHYTLPQAAKALGIAYSWAYELIVRKGALPCILWEKGSRGPYTPTYLVPRDEVRRYKRRLRERAAGGGRPLGRPRVGEKPRKVAGARNLQRSLIEGRQLVAYRKAHGRYPLPNEWDAPATARYPEEGPRDPPRGKPGNQMSVKSPG